jgi:hypothetical protein
VKFRNTKDHSLSFILHGAKVSVPAGETFDVKDEHAFAVSSMGLPVTAAAPDAPLEGGGSVTAPAKGSDGKFVKKSA